MKGVVALNSITEGGERISEGPINELARKCTGYLWLSAHELLDAGGKVSP